MREPFRPWFSSLPGERFLAPESRFQRYRWVVLAVAVALGLAWIFTVHALNAKAHPLAPVGAGVVFISVVVAGLSGTLVGLLSALAGVVAAFVLLADFSTATGTINAIASALVWSIAAVVTGLTVGYLRRQVARREAALEQALNRSLVARERMERVLDFSPRFYESADLTAVAQTICDTARETFGSDGVQIHSLEGSVLQLIALSPPSDSLRPGLISELPDQSGDPVSLPSHRPTFWPDVRSLKLEGDALQMLRELDVAAALQLPIVSLDRIVAVLCLTWHHQIERPGEELLAIMQRFGDQAGIAWQATLRLEAQRQADALRETQDRVLALAPSFHIPGTREEVSEAVCQAALDTFDCTAAAMYRVEGDRLRVLARLPHVKALRTGLTFPLTGEMPLARELRSRAPVFVGEMGNPSGSVKPWPPEVMRRADTRSALYIPLRLEEQGPRNLFVLAWNQVRERPDDAYLLVVQRFSDQAALAMTNASAQQLYARFEASLLPPAPVEHPLLQVLRRYRAGEQRLKLGGDFVGSVVDSATQDLHFLIGDVSGHGPNAAALGATLRATWKALALANATIPDIVSVMDQVLLAERMESSAFATILVGTIDGDGHGLTLKNVGHPPPFLITDRVTPLEMPPVTPLGFGAGKGTMPRSFPLPKQWSIFSYTDGLTEARLGPRSRERYGEDRLKDRLRSWAGVQPGEASLDELLAEIKAAGGGSFGDDVAVLLISTKSPSPTL